MKQKTRRILILFLTLVFACGVFTATVFAESSSSVPPPSKQTSEPPGEENSSSAPTSSNSSSASSQPESNGSNNQTNSSNNPGGGTRNSSVSSSGNAVTNPDTQQGKIENAASEAAAAVSDPDVLASQDWSGILAPVSEAEGEVSAASAAESVPEPAPGGFTWMFPVGIALIVLALGGIAFFIYAQVSGRRGRGGPGGPGGAAGGDEPTAFVDISSDSSGVPHREGYFPDQPVHPGDRSDRTAGERPAAPAARHAAASDTEATILLPKAPAVRKPAENPPVPPHADHPKPPAAADHAAGTNRANPGAGGRESTAPVPQAKKPGPASSAKAGAQSPPKSPAPPDGTLPKAKATPVQSEDDFDWEKFFRDDH